jgi:hypothetical protein
MIGATFRGLNGGTGSAFIPATSFCSNFFHDFHSRRHPRSSAFIGG